MTDIKQHAGGLRWLAETGIGFEWPLIALMAGFLIFPSPARSLAMLLAPALWICRRYARGRYIDRTPLDWAILLLALTVLISLFASFDIAFSLPKIAGITLGLSLYYGLVHHCRDRKAWGLAASVFALAGLAVGVLGLLGTNWNPKFAIFDPILARVPARISGLPGAEGGFHPNEVAGALLWVTPLFCALSMYVLTSRRAISHLLGRLRTAAIIAACLLSAVFLTGVLFLTQSRSGLLGFAAAILPMLAIQAGKPKVRWVFLALILLMSALVFVTLDGNPGQIEAGAAASSPSNEGGVTLLNLQRRFEIWSRALLGIQDFPFTGMGLNSFRRVVHVLYPPFLVGPDVDIGHAHNALLQAALDLGIPGLVAYVSVNAGAIWMLLGLWRARDSLPFSEPLSKALILGLSGALMAHLVYGMLDAVALGAKPGILWWFLLGLIASLYRFRVAGAARESPYILLAHWPADLASHVWQTESVDAFQYSGSASVTIRVAGSDPSR